MGSDNNMVAVPGQPGFINVPRGAFERVRDGGRDPRDLVALFEASVKRVEELEATLARLAQPDAQQGEGLLEALTDPAAVHLNMLRGGIAKPSIANIIHLYGADALRAAATQPAVPQEDAVERAARTMCEADGLDPDEEIVGGQATGFESYGPLWQAEDRSEGQLGLTNYKRLARAALTGAGENGEQGV